LAYRQVWEDDFRAYLKGLDAKKPVLVCGDMNVAHKEIDIKNFKSNRGHAGFTDEERAKMTLLLESGFTDSFRHLYPDKEGAYTWWSYMFKARSRNSGWRIDYWLVSNRWADKISDSLIYSDIMGSDHCPVGLLLKR
jgi:exodeoxyribonuclease-3